MNKKALLILVLSIIGFLAIYLYYVKKDRQESIVKYFPDPHINDIYKVQRNSRAEGRTVTYLKIKDIGKGSLYFYPGYSSSNGINDGFLNHFDTSDVVVYTKKELLEMKEGKSDAEILEIVRK